MKKEYKILILIFIIEFICASVLSELGVSVHSWLGNTIGVLVGFGPLLILFHLLSKDNNVSEKKRMLSKIAFGFIIFCYLVGAVGKALELGLIRL